MFPRGYGQGVHMQLLMTLLAEGAVSVEETQYSNLPIEGMRSWYTGEEQNRGFMYEPSGDERGARIVGNYLILPCGGTYEKNLIKPFEGFEDIDPTDLPNERLQESGPWVGYILSGDNLKVINFACADQGIPIAIDLRRFGDKLKKITLYDRTYGYA